MWHSQDSLINFFEELSSFGERQKVHIELIAHYFPNGDQDLDMAF